MPTRQKNSQKWRPQSGQGAKVFVGRRAELEDFVRLLEEPTGKVILVAGSPSMGKSTLLKKMMLLAESHTALKCTCLSYQMTPTDGVDSSMLVILGDVSDAAVSLSGGIKRYINQNRQKLSALLGAIPLAGSNLKSLGELFLSLAEEARQRGNARQKLGEMLAILSEKLPENGRMGFFIDPEKLMPEKSADAWRLVLGELPEKIMFVFAQRPYDALIGDSDFTEMDNVHRVPKDMLEKLSEAEVEELIEARKGEIPAGINDRQILECLNRYDGHPFAVQAAIDLLIEGVRPEELPDKPEPVKFSHKIIETVEREKGPDALAFLEAAAVLEIPVSRDVITEVAGLSEHQGRCVLADRFAGGLFRQEAKGLRIYHIILADEVLKQCSEGLRKDYHRRAAAVYRKMLAEAEVEHRYPDETAVERLPVHVREGEGEQAFVKCFINECESYLRRFGLLDLSIHYSEQALVIVRDNSEAQAVLYGNLGIVYRVRWELDKAEAMHRKSLAIDEQLGCKEGMANQYGNLGNVYQTRGELDKAEAMYQKSLVINQQLGCKEGMTKDYGGLGNVYQIRGEFDKAEKIYRKSLAIDEQLGNKEGMANQYGNLGIVYAIRGKLDKAEAMHQKSLTLNEQLDRKVGMATGYGNLGDVYYTRGKLDKAEVMYRKGLAINEQLGNKEGMANQYGNLGNVYKIRREMDTAKVYWQKAMALFTQIGATQMAKRVRGRIDEV